MDGSELVLGEAKLRTGMSRQRCSAWRWIQPEDFGEAFPQGLSFFEDEDENEGRGREKEVKL